MAANEYFNTHPTNQYPYHAGAYTKDYISTSSANRMDRSGSATPYAASPFVDSTYAAHPTPSQQSLASDTPFFGVNGSRRRPEDPFSDNNAIPMQAQGTKLDNPGGMGSMSAFDHDDSKQSRVKRKMKGFFKKRQPWVVYILSFVQLCVFIAEIAKNAALTGTPIQTEPNFNPMIGPSPYVLINMGARFGPCMRNTEGVQDSELVQTWPCPNTTSTDADCQLSDLCGFGGVPNPRQGGSLDDKPEPNQWFRFILPIFLHAGLIHIAFNLLIQLTLGKEMELTVGWVRFILVYFSSGIFGFVLGGNYAGSGIASTGASGALFGIIALVLLDLLYTWRERRKPLRDLLWIILDIIIAFALGLLPGLDNFSHIGGFLMGLVFGVCILRSPNILRERIGAAGSSYNTVTNNTHNNDVHSRNHSAGSSSVDRNGNGGARKSSIASIKGFARDPLSFFRGRKPLWWGWWLMRAGALVGVLVGFIVLLNNFYEHRVDCEWCKYLSCIDFLQRAVGAAKWWSPSTNWVLGGHELEEDRKERYTWLAVSEDGTIGAETRVPHPLLADDSSTPVKMTDGFMLHIMLCVYRKLFNSNGKGSGKLGKQGKEATNPKTVISAAANDMVTKAEKAVSGNADKEGSKVGDASNQDGKGKMTSCNIFGRMQQCAGSRFVLPGDLDSHVSRIGHDGLMVANWSKEKEPITIADRQNETYGITNVDYEDNESWSKVQQGKKLLSDALHTSHTANESKDQLIERLFNDVLNNKAHDMKPKNDSEPWKIYMERILKENIYIPRLGGSNEQKRKVENEERKNQGSGASDYDAASKNMGISSLGAGVGLAATTSSPPTSYLPAPNTNAAFSVTANNANATKLTPASEGDLSVAPASTSKSLADKLATQFYGTTQQTIILVSSQKYVTFVERTLYDANGCLNPPGPGRDRRIDYHIRWQPDASSYDGGKDRLCADLGKCLWSMCGLALAIFGFN